MCRAHPGRCVERTLHAGWAKAIDATTAHDSRNPIRAILRSMLASSFLSLRVARVIRGLITITVARIRG